MTKDMIIARSGEARASVRLTHDGSGKIQFIECNAEVNSGSATGMTESLRSAFINHFDEVHSSSRVSVTCSLCRTDRSPGLMGQMHGTALGAFISEEMIAQISSRVSVPVHSLRKINFIHFMDDNNSFKKIDVRPAVKLKKERRMPKIKIKLRNSKRIL